MREIIRETAQLDLEDSIPKDERNVNGQYATPFALAKEIVTGTFQLCPQATAILEPACGTGSFISAIRSLSNDVHIVGYEKDSRFASVAQSIWNDKYTKIFNDDFLSALPHEHSKYDLIITNPPYSRHHHLSDKAKEKYGRLVRKETGVRLSRLSGLHAYFILLSNLLLKANGYAVWLIPAEFFSVNYSNSVKEHLTSKLSIIRIHFFNTRESCFDDALVSSCVLVVKNCSPNPFDKVELSYGNFTNPDYKKYIEVNELKQIKKWQHFAIKRTESPPNRLGDYFTVSRGIATGCNRFFVRKLSEWSFLGIPSDYLIPIVPPPRLFHKNVFDANDNAATMPYLLSIPASIAEPELPLSIQRYLAECDTQIKLGYILKKRKVWYSVETKQAPPIICTYMGRSQTRPFRFIRNTTKAMILNTYLGLYPIVNMTDEYLDMVCDKLNSIPVSVIQQCCREYGGGLKKLEPRELLSVPFSLCG